FEPRARSGYLFCSAVSGFSSDLARRCRGPCTRSTRRPGRKLFRDDPLPRRLIHGRGGARPGLRAPAAARWLGIEMAYRDQMTLSPCRNPEGSSVAAATRPRLIAASRAPTTALPLYFVNGWVDAALIGGLSIATWLVFSCFDHDGEAKPLLTAT